MIPHHVHLRPTLDGSRVVDVTLDLSAEQLDAGSHAVRRVVAGRYQVTALESADDILAMRELTVLADELSSLVVPGAIARLTLNIASIGRFRDALEDYVHTATDEDAIAREGDREALPAVFAMIDGIADAHHDAMRVALGDEKITRG